MNLIPSRVCASQSFFSEHLFEQHCLLSTFNIRIPIGKWANAVVFLYYAVLLHQCVLTPRAWLDLILPAQCPVISDHHTNQKSRRSYLKPNWIYQTIKTNLMSELVFLEKFGPLMHFVAFTFTLRGFVNKQLAIFISQKQCTEQHEMGVPRKVFFAKC